MLRVTLDAFSGLEPPSYVLEAADAREILREISRNRGAITDLDAGFTGLGFRGAILEPLSDDIADEYDLPEIFKVGAGGSQDDGAGFSLAERLIQMLPDHTPASSWQDAQLTFDRDLVTYLTGLLEQTGGRTATDLDGAEPQVIAPTDVTC